MTTLKTTHHHPSAEVPMMTLPDSLTMTVNQMTTVQPMAEFVVLVKQSTQNLTIEEPVIHHLADPQLDAVIVNLKHNAILDEAMADSAAAAPLSNPKIIIAPFVLDEKVWEHLNIHLIYLNGLH